MQIIVWILLVVLVTKNFVLAELLDSVDPKKSGHHIEKRSIYMTFQDRAQAICIGFCMYQERGSYYRCQKQCKVGDEKISSKMKKQRRRKSHVTNRKMNNMRTTIPTNNAT